MPFENPPRTNRIIRKGTPRGQVVYKVGGKDYVFMEKYDTYPDLRPDTRNPRYAYLTKDGEVRSLIQLQETRADLVAKIAAGQTTLEQAITTAAAADPLSVKGGFFSELVRTSNRLDNEHMFLKALVSNSTSAKQVVRRIHKQLESLM